jgi:integrase
MQMVFLGSRRMRNGPPKMIKVNIPHVKFAKKRLADGTIKTFYYHRRTGRKIEGELGTAAFMASYEEACNFARQRTETFATVIADYYGSKLFTKLSERTRSDYIKLRNVIEPKWGGIPLEVLKDERIKRDFRKWRDGLCDERGDRQADLIFAVTRRIVSFAVDDGRLPINHLIGIEGVYESDRSDIIWLPEHVEAFMKTANRGMQLALILALNLGRREGDLIRLTWDDFKGDIIMVTNRKRGRKAKFPAMVTQALRDALMAYKQSLGVIPHPSRTILTSPRKGEPWPDKQFSNKFSKAKNEAGLTELHFHDLRGTAVTVLAEHGCTEMQIASITGHSLKQVAAILDKYLARTRALNVEATLKLEQTWIASIAMR